MEKDSQKGKKKKIVLTHSELLNRSDSHINLFEDMSFYDKKVFFTDNLKGDRLLYYQLVGYRGGHAEPIEYPTDTNIVVVANKVAEYLKMSVRHYMIEFIELKLNSNPNLTLLIESDFLRIIEQRANRINDQPSLDLLKRIKESYYGTESS